METQEDAVSPIRERAGHPVGDVGTRLGTWEGAGDPPGWAGSG